MYGDKVTAAMKYAIAETARRRALQTVYNTEHGITPQTIIKPIHEMSPGGADRDYYAIPKLKPGEVDDAATTEERVELLREQMLEAAESLDFERAAGLRDQLRALEKKSGRDVVTEKTGAYAGGLGSAAYGGAAAPAKKSARKPSARRRR